MSGKHTPTPWDYIEGRTKLLHIETSITNAAGAGLPVCSIPAKRRADAAFIVQAVNAHDEMKAALEEARKVVAHEVEARWECDDQYDVPAKPVLAKIDAALAKASAS